MPNAEPCRARIAQALCVEREPHPGQDRLRIANSRTPAARDHGGDSSTWDSNDQDVGQPTPTAKGLRPIRP